MPTCTCCRRSLIWVCWIELFAVRVCYASIALLFGAQKEGQYLVFLLYEIYHRVDIPINEYLNHFVAACNTRASIPLGGYLWCSRASVTQFTRSFLPAVGSCRICCRRACLRMGTLISFKSTMNLRLLRA